MTSRSSTRAPTPWRPRPPASAERGRILEPYGENADRGRRARQGRGARRASLGRADAAIHRQLSDRPRSFRLGRRAIRAFGIVKKCAALANRALGQLPAEKADLIARAADKVIAGRWDDEFPLV